MPIRLCQLITELRPAGAERCVYELATRLPRGEFQVEVAAFRGGPVAEALRAAGVPVHTLDVCCKADLRALPRLVRVLRRGRFDILHTHLFHADLGGRLAALSVGVPHLVHTVHVAERRSRPWQFAFARGLSGMCDRIVAVSRGVCDFHARRAGLPRHAYTVIHNGIDTGRYRRDESLRLQWRGRLGLAEGDVLCVFVGRLDEQKGIPELLDALAAAAGGRPGLRLAIAGDGPMRPLAEERIGRADLAGRAKLLGFVEDVPGLLSAGDLFLQPSRWEGFCLAAAEAMAAGLAVVGTDVAGLNEVVADGETGLLCRAGDVAGLREAIARLADDPALRSRLGQAGRQRASERFGVARFVAEHAQLYREVAVR